MKKMKFLYAAVIAFGISVYATPAIAAKLPIWVGRDTWPRNFVYLLALPGLVAIATAQEKKEAGESATLWEVLGIGIFLVMLVTVIYFLFI